MRHVIPTSLVLMFVSYSIAGCTIGPSKGTIEERMDPAGIRVQVFLTDNRAPGGELLYITADEIGLLASTGVAILPSNIVERIKVDGSARVLRVERDFVRKKDLDDLRPLSRFPAGIPEGALDQLIEYHGRHSVNRVEGTGAS